MAATAVQIPDTPLPTLDRLNATVPENLDAKAVARTWFDAFSTSLSSPCRNVQSAASRLFVPDAFWRDILSFTWDFRTFSGLPSIVRFLDDRVGCTKPRAFKLREDAFLGLQRPAPDLAWISFFFDFETEVGVASGIVRLVPTATTEGEWKAHTVFTNLEDLKGFPEKVGALRDWAPNHGKWADDRKREAEFGGGSDLRVLIVGGGQSGLGLAARLKALEVPTLVIEKNARIGDNWRNRYDALCLHDPVWYDHMPYLPFPPTWPVYTPAKKLANWLEHYANALEINIWTSSTVTNAAQDESSGNWNVTVKREDGAERSFIVRHLVFATGIGSGEEKAPSYPGMDMFKGEIIHSTRFKDASNHQGKKVVIVGACTSAHDIAADCYENGIDVTMYQRSSTCVMSTAGLRNIVIRGLYAEDGPPTEIADRLMSSFPHFMGIGMFRRSAQAVAEFDKEILDGLRKVGFRLNSGLLGTGILLLVWSRGGGYYLDTGASKLIGDGKIKLKNDSPIEGFMETGLKFEDGSELQADVVVFATGYGDSRAHIKKVCGDAVFQTCKQLWGFDAEGEINGIWRDLGVRGLWSMMGNLMLCRFHSKHVALQIKAIEEGVFGERYSLAKN